MSKGQGGVQPISGGSERGQEKEAAGNVVREGRGRGTGRDRSIGRQLTQSSSPSIMSWDLILTAMEPGKAKNLLFNIFHYNT